MVVLGSAGLTTNVQDNKNEENMLLIKDKHVYDFFKRHFDSITTSSKVKKIDDLLKD